MKVVVPIVAGFSVVVAALLWFWPRPPKALLTKERKRVQILDIHEVSPDTKRFRLDIGGKKAILGLPIGKHMSIYAPNPQKCVDSGKWNGKDDPDKGKKEIERKYTPITGDETKEYVDLVIKMYRPGKVKMPDGKEIDWADGGKIGLYLDSKKVGDYIEINGPSGIIEYLGKGTFKLPGRTITTSHVGMMAGGTGITPMLQVMKAALRLPGDTCKYSLIYANKTTDDILVKDLLDEVVAESKGRMKVYYTLDFPPAGWDGKKGFITTDMIKECLPALEEKPLMLMCGPPPMVQYACKQNLETMGYPKNLMMAF